MSTDTTRHHRNPHDSVSDDWAQALGEQASASNGSATDERTRIRFGDGTRQARRQHRHATTSRWCSTSRCSSPWNSGAPRCPIKYILQLAQGSIVELDALAGEPMDVLINGYLIAQGEVVVVNEKFGIRLTDIVTPSERMRRVSRS